MPNDYVLCLRTETAALICCNPERIGMAISFLTEKKKRDLVILSSYIPPHVVLSLRAILPFHNREMKSRDKQGPQR